MFCSSFKNGSQVDINETDEYGFTALHMASENGHLKVIAKNCVGLTVFTNIVHQVVEELLAAGAKLDPLVFDSYLLPLHMAINKVPYLPHYFLITFCKSRCILAVITFVLIGPDHLN